MPSKKVPQKLSEEVIRAVHRKDYKILTEQANLETINLADKYGRTLLIYALLYGDASMLDWVLKRSPSLDAQDKTGWTALHFTAQNYAVDEAKKLLNAGASIDIQDDYGNTALWRATFESRGRGGMIELMLTHGADYNLKNNHGVSPVELAATIANYDVIKYFNIS